MSLKTLLAVVLQLQICLVSAQTPRLHYPDLSTVEAGFNPKASCNQDNYFPPRCTSNTADTLGGETCGVYGYDCIWEVKDVTRTTHRRIEVNGHWPPPAVQVKVGERIRIALKNEMNEDVTLHFHGLLMENGYTVMDGPQGLIQG